MADHPDLISVIQSVGVDAAQAKSWPFEEAKKILKRINNTVPEKGYVLLETGYGPSGLPHIGTFGEVARTSMVRHAFSVLSPIPTRLFAFSDDMDSLRKVPDNVPNREMLSENLGRPLTQVPDPYEQYPSFGEHNNAMLRRFLDSFGFEYEFQSATDHYRGGNFDAMLLKVLEHYDEIMAIMLPTLRAERQATYSPFLPISPKTGRVLQVSMEKVDPDAGTVIYKDPDTGAFEETPVTGGNCKLQWKVDWGGRWSVFDVDYEMSGKDLIPSVALSTRICKVLGGNPPIGFSYELFLDQDGQKISKSKGNGLTIEEWLKYAPQESLAYYMFQSPRKAKRLYFDVIPRAVDEYLHMLAEYDRQTPLQQLDNPVFHIHNGNPPKITETLSFNMLLNLASVCGAETADVLWGFVQRYMEDVTPDKAPFIDEMIQHAIAYYQGFIKPHLDYRVPTSVEKAALTDLYKELQQVQDAISADSLQTVVFEVGKRHPFDNLRQWFQSLYEVLLGNSEGPRFGSFIALYGVDNMCRLIEEKLREED